MKTLRGHFGAASLSKQCNVLGNKELTMETREAYENTKKENGLDKGVRFGVDNRQREENKGFCDSNVLIKRGSGYEGLRSPVCERVCA